MKKKAREIQQKNREMAKSGRNPGFNTGGGFGSGNYRTDSIPVIDSSSNLDTKPSYSKQK